METEYDGYLLPECRSCEYWMDQYQLNTGCIYPFNCDHIHETETIFRLTTTKKYSYSGPVFIFDSCVDLRWHGETSAVSEKKAICNLTYQWKIDNGYAPNAKVRILNKLLKEESFSGRL